MKRISLILRFAFIGMCLSIDSNNFISNEVLLAQGSDSPCGNAIECAVQAINSMEVSRKLMRDTEEKIKAMVETKFSELSKQIDKNNKVNDGLIGYFEGNCPEGWEEYTKAKGRFFLTSGEYINVTKDGREEKTNWHVGQTGGEIDHKLTINEFPSHNHGNGPYQQLLQYDGKKQASGGLVNIAIF